MQFLSVLACTKKRRQNDDIVTVYIFITLNMIIHKCSSLSILNIVSIYFKTTSRNGSADVIKSRHQGPLLLTWPNFNPSMDK